MSVGAFHLLCSSEDVQSIPTGLKLSPDGLCVLTSLANSIHLYNLCDLRRAALTYDGGEILQWYEWYPLMNSNLRETCCFLGTSRQQSVHLYDAYEANLIRASYIPYNERDEMESPLVATFSPDGQRIVCGGFSSDRYLSIFDVGRPGKDSTRYKLGKTRRSNDGQKGLVRSMSFSPEGNILAVGTYSPGSIYLYDVRTAGGEVGSITVGGVCLVGHGKNHAKRKRRLESSTVGDDDDDNDLGENIFSAAKAKWFQSRVRTGVTQLEFCREGDYLFSASRKSDAVLQWDVRMMSNLAASKPMGGYKTYACNHSSNQRMGFTLQDDKLYVGDRDKSVKIYDTRTGNLLKTLDHLDHAVSGVGVYNNYVVVSQGERVWEETDSEEATRMIGAQGSIQLYQMNENKSNNADASEG